MLELKPKKKLLSQRNKTWIENGQSPLCLILLTIYSPKNHFFSKPDSQLLLAQGISHRSRVDSAGSQLWPLTGRRPPKEHLLFLLCPALPAPPLWLTWLIFLSRLPSVTTRSTYHGAPALHPSLAVFIFLMSGSQGTPQDSEQQPDVSLLLATPFSFWDQLCELRPPHPNVTK